MSKKKIVVFSGAGLDRESGVLTFRDTKDGMWNNYKIEDVATPRGWKNNPQVVLDFYNERRREMPNVQPNKAHKALVDLEEDFEVIHVTQNVSDLLERAGATTVYHLHGELTKARGEDTGNILDRLMASKGDKSTHIGYNDINLGDLDFKTGTQLRPHIVWFGEYPFHVNKAYEAMNNADILVVIGTSLQIGYTLDLLQSVTPECRIVYIDPEPMNYLSNYGMKVEYIREKAEKGVIGFVNGLLDEVEKENK